MPTQVLRQSEGAQLRAADRLQVLADLAALTASTLDLRSLIEGILARLVATVSGADVAIIYLYDSEQERLLPYASVGLDETVYSKIRLSPGETVSGKVFLSGRSSLAGAEETARLASDLSPENRRLFEAARGGRPLQGSIVCPLRGGSQQVFGTVSLGSTRAAFTEEDLSLVEVLAAQAGFAIENARLYADARQRATDLEAALAAQSAELAERERAEEALRASEARFRAIFEDAGIGIVVTGLDGVPVLANRARLAMLGYSMEELRGQHFAGYTHPEDIAVENPLFRDLVSGARDRYRLLKRYVGKSGRITSAWLTASLVRDAAGQPAFVVAMVEDVTDRLLAEQELRRVLASAKCLLWHGVVYEDPGASGGLEWELSMWDEEAAQRFFPLDVPPAKSYEWAWYRSKPEEDRASMERVGNAAVRAGAPGYQQEFRCRRRDGAVRWMWEDVHIEPVSPSRWRVVGVCTDITERKRAEERSQAFQVLGERLNTAAEPEEAARIIVDVADGLIGWDACWLELWEPDARETTTLLMMDIVDGVRGEVLRPYTGPEACARARETAENGPHLVLREPESAAPGEFAFGDVDRPSASLMFVPIRGQTGTVGLLSIQSYSSNAFTERDLETLQALADYCAGALQRTSAESARQHLEERLRQAQKMEAVGRLAGGVAHDFNNMLAVILGYSDLLLAQVPADDRSRTALSEIKRAGERAASLTSQLLAYSRRQMLAPQVLDLNEVIADIEQMLQRLIGTGVNLRTHLAPDLGRVRADPGQVQQVLMNLAVNARDAMPEGGRLRIRTRNTNLGPAYARAHLDVNPGPYVLIEVADTGCGMDEETVAQIFEPFFTTKEVGKGTGLGLATVYGIVKQSDGHIDVQSAPGQGTLFRIYLPRVEEDVAAAPGGDDDVPGGSETVLLVEDEDMVRGLAREMLQTCGYVVLEAADPAEGLRLAERHEGAIHLLLTDLVMPGMGGRQLRDRFKLLRPDAKVVYMSGFDEETAREGSEEGFAFVSKPFSREALATKVREVLDS